MASSKEQDSYSIGAVTVTSLPPRSAAAARKPRATNSAGIVSAVGISTDAKSGGGKNKRKDETSAASSAAAATASAGAGTGTDESAKKPKVQTLSDCKREKKYEYLDHTADVQLHSWGVDLKEAFENVIIAMSGYMTEISRVQIDSKNHKFVIADGHDMDSLLYNYMDKFLYLFATEDFITRDVKIVEFDTTNFRIKAEAYGELFSLDKHESGTEVKAITYSNMQIHDPTRATAATATTAATAAQRAEVYVIIDI